MPFVQRSVRRLLLSMMQLLLWPYRRQRKQLRRKRGSVASPPMFYRALRGHHHHHRRLSIIQVPVQHQHESRCITDEETARSLARLWRVDALQPASCSSAMSAVSIPASSFNHAQSPSASASAIVTPHVSISTSPPPQNSRIYSTSNGDSSLRRLRAPSAAKPPPSQSYLSSSKVRVEDMAPQGRSATVEGYKTERSGLVAGPSTPSSSPPSMSPSTSPPSRTHSRQPSGGTGTIASSSSWRARAPSVSATPPLDPSSSAHVNQPGQDTHGMTTSIISHSPSPSSLATTTKSRPIEKKSVSLRAGSSSLLDDDAYTTSNAHNAASYAFSVTKCIA